MEISETKHEGTSEIKFSPLPQVTSQETTFTKMDVLIAFLYGIALGIIVSDLIYKR